LHDTLYASTAIKWLKASQ